MVIPTKNRIVQLLSAIESVIRQGNYVKKIIIIDQSDINNESILKKKFLKIYDKQIIYKYNPNLKGLVDAKSFSLQFSSSLYISFLDDDVVISKDFYKILLSSFKKNPKMLGGSGIIYNLPRFSIFYFLFFYFFHIGIYFDLRPLIYCRYFKEKKIFISSKISGGLSIWKKQIFNEVTFDTNNFFHFIEDIEFSERVNKKYPFSLFINTDAHIDHNMSLNLSARATKSKQIFYKIVEYKKFYRKHQSIFNYLCTQWLFIGFFLESLYYCLKFKNIYPLVDYFNGIFSNGS